MLALVAAALVLMFAYGDAYHAALYRLARGRAIKLERLLDGWIDRLGIDADDPDAVVRARSRLEMHRFGVQRSLRKPGWKDLLRATPRPVFWVIYPTLLVASLTSAALYA